MFILINFFQKYDYMNNIDIFNKILFKIQAPNNWTKFVRYIRVNDIVIEEENPTSTNIDDIIGANANSLCIAGHLIEKEGSIIFWNTFIVKNNEIIRYHESCHNVDDFSLSGCNMYLFDEGGMNTTRAEFMINKFLSSLCCYKNNEIFDVIA
jgi:hypothetical protein